MRESADHEPSEEGFVEVLASASEEPRRLTPTVDMGVIEFVRHKEMFKQKLSVAGYAGHLARFVYFMFLMIS